MKRDVRIDALRSLAIILIMVAHVGPPELLFEIRIFDVPLMAFLMGASYVVSGESTRKESIGMYIWKRFKRLILPTWIFLAIFFLTTGLEYRLAGQQFPYPKKMIIHSFNLESGIGFVWIIRVFFIISIVTPALFFLAKKSNTFLKTIVILLAMFVGQVLLCQAMRGYPLATQQVLENYVAIPFGYCIAAFVGMKASKGNLYQNTKFSIAMTILFFVSGAFEHFQRLHLFKYPPAPYYLLYGISMSITLYSLLSISRINRIVSKVGCLSWISKHSMELYYWHIMVLANISLVGVQLSIFSKFIVLIIGTFVLTIIQTTLFPNLLSGKWGISKSKKSLR